MTSGVGTLSQRDICQRGPRHSVNTIPVYPVLTFVFDSQPSPFISTHTAKGKKRKLGPPRRKYETLVQIVACGQEEESVRVCVEHPQLRME